MTRDFHRITFAVAIAALVAAIVLRVTDFAGLLAFAKAFLVIAAICWWVPQIMSEKKERGFVLSLTFLAVFLRILVGVLLFSIMELDGSDGYAMGNGRKFDRFAWAFAQQPGLGFTVTYRFPAFIYFMGMVYKVFGSDAHMALLPVLFIALAGGLIAPFTYYFASRAFDQRTGKIAGLLVALHPEFVYHASIHIRDQMTAFGLVIGLCGAVLIGAGRVWKGAAAAVMGTAVSMILNPSFGFPAIVGFVVILMDRAKKRGRELAWAVVVVGMLAIVLFGVGQRFLALDTTAAQASFNVGNTIGGQFFVNKLIGSNQAEMGAQRMIDASLARRVIVSLPPVVQAPVLAAWGNMLPLVAHGAYGWVPEHRLAFFFRSLGWHLTLPFLLFGIGAAYVYERRLLLCCYTVGLLVLPAFAGGADIWDATRYRSFGAPLFATMIAVGWVRGTRERSKVLLRLIMAGFTINVLWLAVYSFRLGGLQTPILSLARFDLPGLVLSVPSMLMTDGNGLIVFLLYTAIVLRLLHREYRISVRW